MMRALKCLLVLATLAAPGLATRANDDVQPDPTLVRSGEKLWRSQRIVGPGGRSCAACHEESDALTRDSLSRKIDFLDNLVFSELVTKGRNRMLTFDGTEVRALSAYLIERYQLTSSQVSDPRATQVLTEANERFVEGEYGRAVELLKAGLKLPLSETQEVQANVLLGCIQHVLGDDAAAVEAFAQAFRVDPAAAIDTEVFSPKTVKLFESVRASVQGRQ